MQLDSSQSGFRWRRLRWILVGLTAVWILAIGIWIQWQRSLAPRIHLEEIVDKGGTYGFRMRVDNPGNTPLRFYQPEPIRLSRTRGGPSTNDPVQVIGWRSPTVIPGPINQTTTSSRSRSRSIPIQQVAVVPAHGSEVIDVDLTPLTPQFRQGAAVRIVIPFQGASQEPLGKRLYGWTARHLSWLRSPLASLGHRHPELVWGHCLSFDVELPDLESLPLELESIDWRRVEAR